MENSNKQNSEISYSSLLEDLNELNQSHADIAKAGDFSSKKAQIAQIDKDLAKGWDQVDNATELQRERAKLSQELEPFELGSKQLQEANQLLELLKEDKDNELLEDMHRQIGAIKEAFNQVKLNNLLSTEHAQNDAYLDLQFGSGGVESQDWTLMLKNMYIGYANFKNWKITQITESTGEAGVKSATLLIEGLYAYGLLRTETGIHRMVRKSPFDANHRRHTTFASVFVYPVLKEAEKITIDPKDLRIDTYRSSGAGGQHVNTTDSAVRITHLPTNIVVQSQNDRSQHKNKATAMSMLQSRLDLLQREEQEREKKRN